MPYSVTRRSPISVRSVFFCTMYSGDMSWYSSTWTSWVGRSDSVSLTTYWGMPPVDRCGATNNSFGLGITVF